MRPLLHSYRLIGIFRTELFSLPPLRAEKRGRGVEWHCLVTKEQLLASLSAGPEVTCLFYRVPSSPQEAALLPLGSYSSYRLLGKMY